MGSYLIRGGCTLTVASLQPLSTYLRTYGSTALVGGMMDPITSALFLATTHGMDKPPLQPHYLISPLTRADVIRYPG